MTMNKNDTSILSVLDDNTNTKDESNKKQKFSQDTKQSSEEAETAKSSKEEELKSSFLDLISQLNELKKGSLNLEDLNLSKYKTVLEDTPANWEFSEESETYNTTFEFDEWSDLETFNDFFKKENVDWSVFSNESNQFIVSLTTPNKELAEEFNELFSNEEEEEVEKKSKDNKKKLETKKELSSEKELDLVPLISSELTCFEQGENQYVKIPIARLGSWVHPEYGDIEFKEEDLNRLQSSIESNELGWEPPLFYGHPQEGGAPAEGYLLKAFREGDTLFGIWSVNQTTYEEIKKGRFRYSSAEFLENYISKRSGEELGNVLVGMALTNRPFIPDLPKNVALDEESNTYNFSMELSLSEEENYKEKDEDTIDNQYSSMTDTKNEEQKLREELDNYKAQLTDQQNKLEEYNKELKAVKESYESQLQHANEQIKELTQRIRSSEVEEKLSRLEQLNIPQTEKDRYKELLKNGSLGSSEDDVMRSLEEMSNSFGSTLLEQHGQSTTTQEENKKEQEDGDPLKQSPHYQKYKENLERAKNNKKQM